MKAFRYWREAMPPVLFTLCLLPAPARAEPVECITSSEPSTAEQTLPSCEALFPEHLYTDAQSPWRVGFGAGYGQRSNPLLGGDDIPIYGIVQLSYFGEHFFFDNGDVGWMMAEGRNWNLNLIAGVGGERSFFSFLNDASISFGPGLDGGAGGVPDGEQTVEVEAPDRDLVIDGGLELIWELGGSEVLLQALNDISGKHDGQEVWLSWGAPRRWGAWEFNPSVGVTWMSERAADYYYGVRASEAQPGLPAYQADAAWNPFLRFTLSYSFDSHWHLVSVFQHEKLDGTIKDSSSVVDDEVTTGFVGLYYEF